MRLRRPKIRADCIDGPRPCPWVGCRYHLIFDWKLVPQRLEVLSDDELVELLWEMPETCALDVVVPRYKLTLQEVGDVMGICRERVRQLEERGMKIWEINALSSSSVIYEYYVESTGQVSES